MLLIKTKWGVIAPTSTTYVENLSNSKSNCYKLNSLSTNAYLTSPNITSNYTLVQ